jgi:hypothetical protein
MSETPSWRLLSALRRRSVWLALVALLQGPALALSLRAAGSDMAAAPSGPPIELSSPPPEIATLPAACSLRHPVCVHAPRSGPSSQPTALAAAERAWDVLTGALGLPAPDRDFDGALHVYLTDGAHGGGEALLTRRDSLAHFDRGVAFARVDRATPPGCDLDIALARAIARACLLRGAPATDEGSARAETEMLARLAVPCEVAEEDSLEFQARPERALVDPASDAYDRGASAFYEWLDAKLAREPGALVRGLWALAPTQTPPNSARWVGSPTGFDVLRASLKGALFAGSTLEDVFVRFAVERARQTPPVRLAWHVPWPATARRLASPAPIAPTGASYVLVDHAGVPAGARLRLEAQWEDYGRMRWVVVKLDASGATLAEVPVTSLDRGTQASLTVESIDDVDRLLIVGVNVGSTERAFDPDQGEWEPHGWLLTLSSD